MERPATSPPEPSRVAQLAAWRALWQLLLAPDNEAAEADAEQPELAEGEAASPGSGVVQTAP